MDQTTPNLLLASFVWAAVARKIETVQKESPGPNPHLLAPHDVIDGLGDLGYHRPLETYILHTTLVHAISSRCARPLVYKGERNRPVRK